MISGARFAICMTACCTLFGCAAQDLLVKRQTEAEAKIEYLVQADKRDGTRLNELFARMLSLEEQLKGRDAAIKQLQGDLQELRAVQGSAKSAAEPASLGQNATPRIEIVNPDVPQKGKESGPPAEYVNAFGLYSSNNFVAAIDAFEVFLKQSPRKDYAANALYWIGECYYSLSNMSKAEEYFRQVVDGYPKSAKVPDALLKQGYALLAMKEKTKAVAIFERLVKLYPGSPLATKAREKLTAN